MGHKFPKEIEENLLPGEKILHTIVKQASFEAKPKWLIVSSKRVIYFDQKLLGRYELKDIPYEKLEKVIYNHGALASEFILVDESGLKLILKWLNKLECKKAIETIRDGINAIAVEPVSIQKKKKLMGREEWRLHKPKEVVSKAVHIQRFESQSTQNPSTESPMEKLKKIKELHDMGILTDEEYEEKKNDLMKYI
jgi:hypothetical protein